MDPDARLAIDLHNLPEVFTDEFLGSLNGWDEMALEEADLTESQSAALRNYYAKFANPGMRAALGRIEELMARQRAATEGVSQLGRRAIEATEAVRVALPAAQSDPGFDRMLKLLDGPSPEREQLQVMRDTRQVLQAINDSLLAQNQRLDEQDKARATDRAEDLAHREREDRRSHVTVVAAVSGAAISVFAIFVAIAIAYLQR